MFLGAAALSLVVFGWLWVDLYHLGASDNRHVYIMAILTGFTTFGLEASVILAYRGIGLAYLAAIALIMNLAIGVIAVGPQ